MSNVFGGERILVVEDERSVRNRYHSLLQGCGFSVKTAKNLNSAREAIRRATFHIAWVDLSLRGDQKDRDGYIFIDELNALREGTKIAVVTRHSDKTADEALRAIQDAGADTFIEKSDAQREVFAARCVPKLQKLLSACQVDKRVDDVSTAQRNLIDIAQEGIVTGTILAKLQGVDALTLWNSLLAAYNAMKPIRRSKDHLLTFAWDSGNRVFRSQYWSKAFGCSVELLLGTYAETPRETVIFERTKGVPIAVRKTRRARDAFQE
jgi:CheY-like chemotaxis protein